MYSMLLALMVFLLPVQDGEPPASSTVIQPGIALSFDDTYIKEWYEAHQVFQEYDWRVTFYLSRFHRFAEDEIEMLHRLQHAGHEIAAHGYHHIRAVPYIEENGVEAYLDYEIHPMMEIMHANDFHPVTFAYPYGNRSELTDELLMEHFTLLRGTAGGNPPIEHFRGFFNGSSLVWGRGIDSHRDDYNLPYLLSLLEYAREHNKIVILFGHKTVEEYTDRNQTEYATLRALFEYMKEHDMRFYTMEELAGMIQP